MSSVPIGYFIPALLITWCTYIVMAPRHWPRMFNSLGLYNVVNELPFLTLFFLLGSTWLAFNEGDVHSPLGLVAFGLSIMAVPGLVAIIYRGLKAAPVVSRALDESLGTVWRTATDTKNARRLLQKRFPAKALLGPFFVRRHDVQRVANISYGNAGSRNLLDVYRHRSHPSCSPTLVHLHGGAFVSGRKNRQALPLIYKLASRGWVCISANYRLSPTARFPDHLTDIKRVIAWVREHGHEYGADPDTIFVAGSSAGGHLASLAALTQNDLRFQPGFERVDTSVTAAISLSGYYGHIDPNTELPSSPLCYRGKDAPPFFLAHGNQDTMVPVENARRFVEHLRSFSSNPVVYAELPSAEHVFDMFHSFRNEAIVDGIEAFADWVQTNNKHHVE